MQKMAAIDKAKAETDAMSKNTQNELSTNAQNDDSNTKIFKKH